MKPLFTIHGGEYLTGSEIEKIFGKRIHVWVPSKDVGIDLLVSSADCRRTVTLQVKSSKCYDSQYGCDASGWWWVTKEGLSKSIADYWVFTFLPNVGYTQCPKPRFIIIKPSELLSMISKYRTWTISKDSKECLILYFAIKGDIAVEIRDLHPSQIEELLSRHRGERVFSKYVDNWEPIVSKL